MWRTGLANWAAAGGYAHVNGAGEQVAEREQGTEVCSESTFGNERLILNTPPSPVRAVALFTFAFYSFTLAGTMQS